MVTLERPRAETTAPSAVERITNPRPPRSPWRRRFLGALVAVVTAISALAVPVSMGVFPSLYTPPLPDDAAFAVGDRVFTVADYERRVKTIKALYGAQVPTDPAGADRFRRDSAKAVVVAAVMQDAEAERNIVVPDPKVRGALDQMIAAQFGAGQDGYQKFTQGLAQAGSSEPEVLDEIRQQIGMTELVKNLTAGVQVRDEELPAEFPKYAAGLGVPESRRLANIVVTTPEQANDILNQVRSGIPFADIARRVSLDASTRDAGGDFGQNVTSAQLQPEYAPAAFAVPKGQPFGPVQTPQGWNVGSVLDVVPGQPAAYAESMIPLKNLVINERQVAVWNTWLENALRDADVRYADAYRPADPTGSPLVADGAAAPGAPR